MTKRQAITMFIVSMMVQATLDFGWLPFVIGMAMGAVVAWTLKDVLAGSYRLRRIWTGQKKL